MQIERPTGDNATIFNALTDYMNLAEFQKAQSEYMELHKHRFTSDEENKLEYTTVHEGYVFILENIIDVKLKERFSDDQVKAFYAHMLTNYAMYKALNPQKMDDLMDFLDFNVFKKTMIAFKEASDAESSGKE